MAQTALVTGAAHGIGEGTAKALADRGWSVALVDLELDAAQAAAERCGPNAAAFGADITDSQAINSAVAGAVERFGGIDLCFANAGIGTGGVFRYTDPEVFAVQFEINVVGTFRTVHACLPHLIDSRGYVLLNASASALVAPPGVGSYGATKAAVESFGDTLRREMAHHRVDVGVLYLLWVATDLVEGAERETETFSRVIGSLKGPLGKRMSTSKAVAVIIRGIERRSRRVVAPRLLSAVYRLRGLAPTLIERPMVAIAPEIEAATVRDLESREGVEQGMRTDTPANAAAARRVKERR